MEQVACYDNLSSIVIVSQGCSTYSRCNIYLFPLHISAVYHMGVIVHVQISLQSVKLLPNFEQAVQRHGELQE